MFDFMNPDTFWLNVTNAALGAVTLICCVVVGYSIVKEVLGRSRAAKKSAVPAFDDHALYVSGLGITMADGGKPVASSSLHSANAHAANERELKNPSSTEDERHIFRSEN